MFETQSRQEILHVAVGVVQDRLGRILIARRHYHLHQGGFWEFPGGKVGPEEGVFDALRRELLEELDIYVERASPLITVNHDYGDKRVFLDVWRVDRYSGVPRGLENQPIKWVDSKDLPKFRFPAANRPILAAARLPEFYPIIDGGPQDEDNLFRKLENLAGQGYRLAQWRVKSSNSRDYLKLARRALDHCRPRGLDLILNSDPGLVVQARASGVHLSSRRLMALRQRPLPDELWVAASCHDLDEIRQAENIGVDFIVLSPVLPTASHPEAGALGWDRFGAMTAAANLPVFALGGLAPAHLNEAKSRGAHGISGIRGFDGH